MPSLTLANTVVSYPQKILLQIENATFNTTGEGYATSGAAQLQILSKKMRITSNDDAFCWAYKTFTVTPGVTYDFSYHYFDDGTSNNQDVGLVYLGSTDGGTEYHSSAPVDTSTVTDTFFATSNALYLRLYNGINSDGKWNTWDNILINEVQTY